jgi:hypothetical protein
MVLYLGTFALDFGPGKPSEGEILLRRKAPSYPWLGVFLCNGLRRLHFGFVPIRDQQ